MSVYAVVRHVCMYLVIVSELVLQDVSIRPVRLRPRESDGVWGSAQLVHHRNCAGNCGKEQMYENNVSLRDAMNDH